MVQLFLHGRPVDTVFHLLGVKENDITFSLGWTLQQAPLLATSLLKDVLSQASAPEITCIKLQEHRSGQGITDIEIEAGRLGDTHVIVEAKRGFSLPTEAQLRQYAPRRNSRDQKPNLLLVLSECPDEYARAHLPQSIDGVAVAHRSWRQVAQLVRRSVRSATRNERRVLGEFLTYLETAMPVQNQESNLVFVVSLGRTSNPGWEISLIDVVEKKRRYFHEVGNKWPSESPNYIGFRYNGRLQSIRHVDDYAIGTDPHVHVPEIPSLNWPPHFFYKLGPPIRPEREVLTGGVWPSGHVWAALDLLLTCGTVAEARDETQKRLKASETR